MKKFIPFLFLIVGLLMQGCRQGDDLQDDNQHTNGKMIESARRSDTLRFEHKDPPVKDGQDWIY